VHPGQAYSKAAEAQLDQDFPMFYKTEWAYHLLASLESTTSFNRSTF
jgi:hypothetical protein